MRIVIVAVGAALLVAACGSTATPLPASQAPASTIASPSAAASATSSAASPSAAAGASAGAVASIGAMPSGSLALSGGVTGSGAAALAAIEQAIQQQGGATATLPPWLSEITGADVNGPTLVVKTSLASKTADATDMCTAFSSAVFGGAASAGITGFEIQGASGQAHVTKTSSGAAC